MQSPISNHQSSIPNHQFPNPPSTEIDTIRQSPTKHNENSCPRVAHTRARGNGFPAPNHVIPVPSHVIPAKAGIFRAPHLTKQNSRTILNINLIRPRPNHNPRSQSCNPQSSIPNHQSSIPNHQSSIPQPAVDGNRQNTTECHKMQRNLVRAYPNSRAREAKRDSRLRGNDGGGCENDGEGERNGAGKGGNDNGGVPPRIHGGAYGHDESPRIHGEAYGHDESNGIGLLAIWTAIPAVCCGSHSARQSSDVLLPRPAESSDPQPVRGYP